MADTPDSTSARAPELKHVCGLQGFGRGAGGLFDRCPACEAPATPPSDETPPVSGGTMHRLADGRMRAMATHYANLRAPLVDTPLGGGVSDERTRTRQVTQIGGMVHLEFGLDHTDGYRVTVGWSEEDRSWIARASGMRAFVPGESLALGASRENALLNLACALCATVDCLGTLVDTLAPDEPPAPPSPEGTDRPNAAMTARATATGIGQLVTRTVAPTIQPDLRVAGELHGVGAADADLIEAIEYVDNCRRLNAYSTRFGGECCSGVPTEKLARVLNAAKSLPALRLRAEAAERQLATFTQADVGYLNGLASDPFLPHDGKAADLAKRIAATLSSQRTL